MNRLWRSACFLFCAYIIAIVVTIGLATIVSAEVIDLTKLSMEDLMNIEVTSASKKAEKIDDAPASVFVITRQQIDRWGYRTLAEALRRVVGFYSGSDRNYGQLGVRGFYRPGDYNTRVLLLIDGVRVNDPLYGCGSVEEVFPLDIKSIERIEVVKGPGSALWGTNALFAVINVITKKAEDVSGSNMVQSFGSDSRNKTYFEVGASSSKGPDIVASFSTLNSHGQNSIFFPEYVSDECDGVALGLDGEDAQKGYTSVSYGNSRLLFSTGKRNKTVPTGSFGTVFGDPGNKTYDSTSLLDISYESQKGKTQLLARIFHGHYTYDGDYIYETDSLPYLTNKDYWDAKWTGAEVRASSAINNRLSVTTGVEYTNAYSIEMRNYDADPYYYVYQDWQGSSSVISGYLQTDISLTKKARLVLGARMDDYSTSSRHWSPRIAFIYRPMPDSTLKLLQGSAFREPNCYESYYYDGVSTVDNPGLVPEEITTTELVWEKTLGSQTRLVCSAFNYKIDQMISQITNEDDMLQFINREAVHSRGVEIQAERNLENGSLAYTGLTFLKAVDSNTGQRINSSPRYIANLGISIPAYSGKWFISPEVQIMGKQYTLSGSTIAPSAVVNLTVKSSQKLDKLNFALSVYNLFDQETFTSGSGEHVQDKIPQEGRIFSLETSYLY